MHEVAPKPLSQPWVGFQSALAGFTWLPQLFLKSIATLTSLTARSTSFADQTISAGIRVGLSNNKAMNLAKFVTFAWIAYRVINAMQAAKKGDPAQMKALFLKEFINMPNLLKTVGIAMLLSAGVAGTAGFLVDPKEVEKVIASKAPEKEPQETPFERETKATLKTLQDTLDSLIQKITPIQQSDEPAIREVTSSFLTNPRSSSSSSAAVAASNPFSSSSSSYATGGSSSAAVSSPSSALVSPSVLEHINLLGTQNNRQSLEEIRGMNLKPLFDELTLMKHPPGEDFPTNLCNAMINICKAWGFDIPNFLQDPHKGGAWDGKVQRLDLVVETVEKFARKFPEVRNDAGALVDLPKMFRNYKAYIEKKPPAVRS